MKDYKNDLKVRRLCIKFAITVLENLPSGMFDSTPYIKEQIKSLKEELSNQDQKEK